tara:strand:+ start:2417 stop:4198 length:1782 start_codon:yes stop_codon:yes gene_type:complete
MSKNGVKAHKKKKSKGNKGLSPIEKEKRVQHNEILSVMRNLGFERVPRVDGKEFVYKNRTTELDDIFYHENVVILTEYTVGSSGDHLLKKKIIYDFINEDKRKFLNYLLGENKFETSLARFKEVVLKKYHISKLQIVIMYCSKKKITGEHKSLVGDVVFFDYPVVKYFESLSKVVKRSARFEFFDFLGIGFDNVGDNILSSSTSNNHKFSGHILPEAHSSFQEGYKIVSFYIDATSLLKRSYVLRKDGWKRKENVGHYQRMLIPSKIKGMRRYLHEKRRVFINNIIATLPIDKVSLYDADDELISIDGSGQFVGGGGSKVTPAKIEIKDETNILGIIDGQHRIFSYHEGDDSYENTISKIRNIQNLLVTGILYPESEKDYNRLKFEAGLFHEINSHQTVASSQLRQEIELMVNPTSATAIAKRILNRLNDSGPFDGLFEQFWFEKNKLKSASIISFGLRPLVKLDGDDSLFHAWADKRKNSLKSDNLDEDVFDEYINFCVTEINKLLIQIKMVLTSERWKVSRSDKEAVLNVTTVNGFLNLLRYVIQNDCERSEAFYKERVKGLSAFNFKPYKSSQYRRLGEDLFKKLGFGSS